MNDISNLQNLLNSANDDSSELDKAMIDNNAAPVVSEGQPIQPPVVGDEQNIMQESAEKGNLPIRGDDGQIMDNNILDNDVVVTSNENKTILEGTIAPGMLTPEEEFKRVTGQEFDPERYEILYHGADNDFAGDDPYVPYTIVEKVLDDEITKTDNSEEEIEKAYRTAVDDAIALYNLPEPTDSYERKAYNEEYIARSEEIRKALEILTPEKIKEAEEEFKRVTGQEFDFDKYEIESTDTENYGEKVDIKDLSDDELDKEIEDFENADTDISFTDPRYQRYTELKNEKEKRLNSNQNHEEKSYSEMNDEELDESIKQKWAKLNPIYGEIDENDPRYIEYWKLMRERERRNKEKEEANKKVDEKENDDKENDEKKNNGWEISSIEVPLDILKKNKNNTNDNNNVNSNNNPTNNNTNNSNNPVNNNPINSNPTNNNVPVNNSLSNETVKIMFMNDGKLIPNYGNIVIEKGGTIKHGPVIDPVPLNKKGKPKKLTAKTFSHWEDQYGNVVDFSQPITEDMILTAAYKFDKKKAVSIGLGAAIGALAYVADLAIPVPVPVVSMIGAAGTKIANHFVKKNLNNLTADNMNEARTITAVDDIPEELAQNILEQKKKGYISTFLKTATVACTISSAAHLLKASHAAEKGLDNVKSTPNKNITNGSDGLTNPDPSHNMVNSNDPIIGQTTNPTPTKISSPTSTPNTVSTDVLGGYEPTGEVYKSAADALSGTNGSAAYAPSFAGEETFEAYNAVTGARHGISRGQELSEIMKMVGASDPSQVAVNVMNADGVPLTWQSMSSMAETVTKTL